MNANVTSTAEGNEVLPAVYAGPAMMHDDLLGVDFAADLALAIIAPQYRLALTGKVFLVQARTAITRGTISGAH